jgi:TRAP-type mannitol/chloroaromatic compound transport system substrate-binding protein
MTLVAQCHAGSGSTFCKAVAEYQANLEIASGGRLDMPAHAGGEIVPSMVELDGINDGVLDFATTCTMYWMDRFGPACNLFTYQIAGLSPTEQFFWMQNEGLDLLTEMCADYNVVFTGGFQTVPELFISTKNAISTPADIKGLKLRTAGDDGKIFTDMGASVVTMSTEETYESLMRGVLDGYQLSSPGYDYSVAMYEVVDYMYVGSVRQPQEWQPQMWNTDTWNKMPDDLKKMITEMGKAAAMNYYRFMVNFDLEAMPMLRDKGVNVDFIPKAIADDFVERAGKLYTERAAEDPFFDKVYKSIEAYKGLVRTTWERM